MEAMKEERTRRCKKLLLIVSICVILAVVIACAVVFTRKDKVSGSSSFRAAVYEHAVKDVKLNSLNLTRDEIWKALSANIDPLTKAANDAKKQGAKIFVFPEYGVTGFNFGKREQIRPLLEDIPAADSGDIPCNTFPNHTIQNWLSCLAKQNKMYIAANVGDLKNCSSKDQGCPADGAYQYNTNVVYDPNGMIVHRYHKINLYGSEINFMDRGKIGQENLIFQTPFGRMSSMVCFDIIFKEPGIPITNAGQIDTMLFLTAWMSKFPHYVSIQYHSAWALRQKVNLLAAEINRPSLRMTGSGLYSPTGIVNYTFNMASNEPKLVVADMQIKPQVLQVHPRIQSIKWGNPQFTSKYYNYVALNKSEDIVTVCKGSICCKAEYKYSNGSSTKEMYALGASFAPSYHNGGSLEICVILKCAGKNEIGCGTFVTNTTATFDSLSLSGNFTSDYVFPSISLNGLQMPQEGQFDMATIGEIKTKVKGLPIVTMVHTGRNYDFKP